MKEYSKLVLRICISRLLLILYVERSVRLTISKLIEKKVVI